MDAKSIAPIVTWGPVPRTAAIDPACQTLGGRRTLRRLVPISRGALEYMGIARQEADRTLRWTGCSSAPAPIRDRSLRAAPSAAGRTSKVPGLVSAGST